jgi:hypothetical protein
MRKFLYGLVIAIGAIAVYWMPVSGVKAVGSSLSIVAGEIQSKTPRIVKPAHCRAVRHCHRRGHLIYCHRCG